MENKKGQASMEFLMTYGWAILAAVLAIGVLAYYGVFSPGNSLPNICAINAPLGCDEYQVNTTGVILILRNGAGDAITVSDVTVGDCTPDVTSTPVANGDTTTYYLTGCTIGAASSKFSGDISVTYTRSGKTLSEISSGSMTAEVR